jgi:hypothetical protein
MKDGWLAEANQLGIWDEKKRKSGRKETQTEEQ